MTTEQEQLTAIRAEIATLPQDQQVTIAAFAEQVRQAVGRNPLLISAFSLVAAEMLVLYPEDEG
jgi:hypothetical protein